jgi:hypothetical protein
MSTPQQLSAEMARIKQINAGKRPAKAIGKLPSKTMTALKKADGTGNKARKAKFGAAVAKAQKTLKPRSYNGINQAINQLKKATK